jgi:hypothetical protein
VGLGARHDAGYVRILTVDVWPFAAFGRPLLASQLLGHATLLAGLFLLTLGDGGP